ncbi:MAG: DUF4215 domain-containing protein [Deltaproteobacteria bacterium]|nr:DUF4215 domain-containing protein [Deltaproteobacteria bacterium]
MKKLTNDSMRWSISFIFCFLMLIPLSSCGGGTDVDPSDTGADDPNNPFCSDGILQQDEECDDGNLINGDGCENDCTITVSESCGNGIVDQGEECDDGNDIDNDDCTNACTNPSCGDGIVQQNEECDDQDNENTNACANDCTINYCMYSSTDKSAEANFGESVAISGNTLVVGADYDDAEGIDRRGSAYVCEKDLNSQKWIQTQKLVASDGNQFDYFGRSVSIYNDYIIIGASNDDKGEDSGAAYVFKRNGDEWNETQKLVASDGDQYDYFGHSVSIYNDYIIIGASNDDDKGEDSGAAYVFKRNGDEWNETQKLVASDGDQYDYFGHSVSIYSDYVVIGARWGDNQEINTGTAYVFKRTGDEWNETQKLVAPDGAGFDYFGHSVSISGNYIVIGAIEDDDQNLDSGAAYVFKRNGDEWNETQKLVAPDGAEFDYFGHSVSISGNYIVIGARWGDNQEINTGTAYVFKRNGDEWIQTQKLLASNSNTGDQFGFSVAIDGDIIIVGAPDYDHNNLNDGFGYIFEKSNLDVWQEVQ